MKRDEIEKLYKECVEFGYIGNIYKQFDANYRLNTALQCKAVGVVNFLRNQKGRGKPISINDFQKLIFRLLEDASEGKDYSLNSWENEGGQ